MTLDRDNFPNAADMTSDLSARFGPLVLPDALALWFAFAREAQDRTILLDDATSAALGEEVVCLDGLRVVDAASALTAMNGYRFVLDIKASVPNRLIWQDQALIGQWREEWIVIESIHADPIIADIGREGVPILFDRHGSGRWAPAPLFDNLSEFIASLRLTTEPAHVYAAHPFYTVNIVDFGPRPQAVLLALKRLPEFRDRTPSALLDLRKQTPLTVLRDNISESLASRIARTLRESGAVVEILERELR